MKPFPLFYLLLLFCTYFEMSAQTKELPWYFSINVNAISLQGEALESGLNLGAPAFVIGRSLFENVSFGSQYALSRVDNFEQSFNYISLDGFLKFNLLNGVIVPYLIGGYGFSQFSNVLNRTSLFPSAKTSKTVFGGIGFNLYLNSNLALNVQVSYREMFENEDFDHVQSFVGLGYYFGSIDSDKDGVSDKKDACPTVAGLQKYDGCPDSDGDGISDHLDSCIDQAGPEENKGCPWPDSDGDGFVDPEDKCMDEAGPKENNGCPQLSKEIIHSLNEFGSRINFVADRYDIFGAKTRENLLKIKELLESHPEGILLIEGYASAEGEQDYNLELSVNRAQAVRKYLITLGVDPSRLEVQGFGTSDPIGDNSRPEGRAINRRVQFKTKKN